MKVKINNQPTIYELSTLQGLIILFVYNSVANYSVQEIIKYLDINLKQLSTHILPLINNKNSILKISDRNDDKIRINDKIEKISDLKIKKPYIDFRQKLNKYKVLPKISNEQLEKRKTQYTIVFIY